ncbi:BREX system serine/threonine kinase PglW [Streptomyces sp. NBC_01481]|uniref:BREX system serine/threonine kinase PglW n=1 Tax=Streptomyces sp. NBC_01481 TaxID=2975869 RepID=UPI00224FD2AC|nr:BREX system serine/threonine kinase PglW [Streptomyces sp. NBC_01481]MCX4587024.1 BREX system serine/threonine kinase PglW [Streptomyces sp. NBC_01481]
MTAAGTSSAPKPGPPPRPENQWNQERPSPYAWEQDALDHIRRLMPPAEPYRAWATFSFTAQSGRINECDLLIAVPAGLYLVEIKSHPGRLENSGSTWNFHGPDRTRTISNPLHFNDAKAKDLKSQLQWAARKLRLNDRALPRIEPAVFLSATDLESHLDDIQRVRVFGRDDGASGLARIWQDFLGLPPDRPERRITPEFSRNQLPKLLKAIGIGQSTAHLKFGDAWRMQAHPLDAGQSWEDRLAKRVDGLVHEEGRVRIYLVGQQATDAAKKQTGRAAQREYQVLQGITHRGIAAAVEIREHEAGPAILFRHRETDLRLDQYLATHGGRLTPEMRLDLVRQLAEAVRYAHNRSLFHRALAARSVYVSARPDGSRPELRITDWQTAARDFDTNATLLRSLGNATLDTGLIEDAAQVYLAPETEQPYADPVDLDVFGLGAVSYLILTGQPPAAQRSALRERLRTDSGLRLFAVVDGVSEELDKLIHQATRPEPDDRLGTVDRFIDLLDRAEEENAAPEPASVSELDPLSALPGQSLDGEWSVRRVLGTGATARALLVERMVEDEDGDSHTEERVFKVALDQEKAERLRAEAQALEQVGGGTVVQLKGGPREVAGRTLLELEYAGERTLGARLRGEGKLSYHELERYGSDLFNALDQLAAKGVRHRDLKPDNLGLYKRSDRIWQLMLFDFSLADASDRDIKAGTRGYLDPFLGSVRRAHYDDHAERYAAAVTLHEMASGERPLWGGGQSDPVASEQAKLSVATELFEPALSDGLTAFFERALHEDTERRFDTLRQMRDAWYEIFRAADAGKPATTPATVDTVSESVDDTRDAAAEVADLDTSLDAAGLSPRAISVANGLGATTVGGLLEIQPYIISKARGAGALVRKELNRRRKQWAAALKRPAAPAPQRVQPDSETPTADSGGVLAIDEMAALLDPASGRKGSHRTDVVRLTLGLPPEDGGLSPLGPWPVQKRVAQRIGIQQPPVSRHHRTAIKEWHETDWLTTVRQTLVDIVEAAGRVMTARELAVELRIRHGAGNDSEERVLAKALAVVRAAIEAETWASETEGEEQHEPRLAWHRREDAVLIAAESLPGTADPTPRELADYAAALGKQAERLAYEEPLPGRAAVVRELRTVPAPDGLAPLADTRLVALAASVAPTAEASPRLELYPSDLTLDRALRISQAGAGVRREHGITPRELNNRLRARFPDLALLAGGAEPTHVELEEALREARFTLEFDEKQGKFLPPAVEAAASWTSTGDGTSFMAPPPGTRPAAQDPHSTIKARLDASVRRGGFLALTVRGTRLPGVAETVAAAYPVTRVDLNSEFLAEFRALAEEKNQPWDKVLGVDARYSASGQISKGLATYVRTVWGRVESRLLARASAPRTVLFLYDAGLVARYWDEGGRDLLVKLQGAARRPADAPHGLWLLSPVETRSQLPHLDGRTVECIGGDGERTHLDTLFLDVLRGGEAGASQ